MCVHLCDSKIVGAIITTFQMASHVRLRLQSIPILTSSRIIVILSWCLCTDSGQEWLRSVLRKAGLMKGHHFFQFVYYILAHFLQVEFISSSSRILTSTVQHRFYRLLLRDSVIEKCAESWESFPWNQFKFNSILFTNLFNSFHQLLSLYILLLARLQLWFE